MPLEKLGPYKLEKLLGRGGMGAVYLASHEESGERAALKVLSGHLADDAGFRDRFKQEIETLKRLLHPNIVQLFGYGEDQGQLFYVMELIQGRSLQDELVAGRRFSWREATRIGIAIARALKHAHDRGIIHRDLKPLNLLIDDEEHIKLTDFGIAKLYGGANVTAPGGVLGTADYMAPEQADGKAVSSRCDLYALGSVLYTILTGKPPFARKGALEVLSAIKHEQAAPVRQLAPDAPEELERIIHQLLEKDPEKRIPTALAVANRLKAMEHALSLETRVVDASQVAHGPPRADKARSLSAKQQDGSSLGSTLPMGAADDNEDYRLAQEEAAAEPNTGRFLRVGEEELRGLRREQEENGVPQWLVVAGLCAAAAALVAGLVYYAAQPPSADRLYAAVKQAADEGGTEGLLPAEAELTLFLKRYPNDPRAAEIKEYQRELEQYRLNRRLKLHARRGDSVFELTPMERAYHEAEQLSSTDPEASLTRFQALIAVYTDASHPKLSAAQKQTANELLSLARKQIVRLQPLVERMVAEERAAIRDQLERAEQLAETDRPSAEKIWRGIVTLYDSKAWAQELVEEATEKLTKE